MMPHTLLNFEFVWESNTLSMLMQGLTMTIIFSVLAVVLGALLSLIPAFMRLSNKKWLSVPAAYYVEMIRGTPMLVQVFLFYELLRLPVTIFIGIDMGSFIPGLIAITINCSAYTSEIIRGGIQSIDKGQSEAALSLGMNKHQVMFKIILPQAIRKIIPSLGNELVTIIKETSIFLNLGIAELMFQINIIKSRTYANTEVYIVAGILYLLLTIPLSKLMNLLERRLDYAKE